MRDYDPTTGRYLEPDPLGLVDGASVYGYVGQNPGRYVDPPGLKILILQHGGHLFDADWRRDTSLPQKVGSRWDHQCSSAQLVYHHATKTDPYGHWHYYPGGDTGGGRRGRANRWRDAEGNDHLYPPYLLDIPECPCDGDVNPLSAIGFAVLGLGAVMLAPEAAAFAGAVVVIGQ